MTKTVLQCTECNTRHVIPGKRGTEAQVLHWCCKCRKPTDQDVVRVDSESGSQESIFGE